MKKLILLLATLLLLNVTSCQNSSFPVEDFPVELRQSSVFAKASKGDIKALQVLALMCTTHKRPDLAIICYKKASELGDAQSSWDLVYHYRVGLYVEKDSVASYKYAQLAMQQDKTGNAHATYGNYVFGGAFKGLEDKPASYYWIKGAEMGDPLAQWQLADYYYNGEYIEQDYEKARMWFEKVLEQPDTLPQIKFMKSQCKQKLDEMNANGY